MRAAGRRASQSEKVCDLCLDSEARKDLSGPAQAGNFSAAEVGAFESIEVTTPSAHILFVLVTVIIYTSDQGFFLGDHGWFDRRSM